MRKNFKIFIKNSEIQAELLHNKVPEMCKWFLENLPLESYAELWGDEIYFSTEKEAPNVETTMKVKQGDIAYWPPGNAICLFFGPTPLSKDKEPVPASGVIVFGKIKNLKDVISKLKNVKQDERVKITT